jgi:hypothetical protein
VNYIIHNLILRDDSANYVSIFQTFALFNIFLYNTDQSLRQKSLIQECIPNGQFTIRHCIGSLSRRGQFICLFSVLL